MGLILFNIDSVREFLKENGEVYTLRKPGKAFRRDIAIHGNYYKPKEILGKVEVILVKENITTVEELKPYVAKSGLNDAKEWLQLAKKLSGDRLDLYHVIMIEPLKTGKGIKCLHGYYGT